MKKFIKLFSVLVIFIYSFLAINTFAQDAFQENEVTFAHLTDIHIWGERDGNKPTYPEILLKDAIKQINYNPKIDFTLITGDIVDFPNEDLFTHVINIFRNGFNKPWYYTLGNHDCSYPYEFNKDILLRIVKDLNPNFVENGRFYSFQPKKGFTFIGLDGGSYYIDEDQIDYMTEVIKSNPNDVIVVFLHTPIMPPFDLKWHDLWQKEELLNYFKQFKQPIAIVAGHYHGTKIIRSGNILHIATPSLRYSQEFRIINIQNKKDRVIFNFIFKKAYLEKEMYSNPAFKGILNQTRYAGSNADKETSIVFLK